MSCPCMAHCCHIQKCCRVLANTREWPTTIALHEREVCQDCKMSLVPTSETEAMQPVIFIEKSHLYPLSAVNVFITCDFCDRAVGKSPAFWGQKLGPYMLT